VRETLTTYLIPATLTALALLVLGAGLPFSNRFLRRGRYIGGLIAISIGLISLWLLQLIVTAMDLQWETRWVLQIAAFVFSLSMFAGGLGALSKANNTPRDDFYDDLFT
jgi:hypothetical protein